MSRPAVAIIVPCFNDGQLALEAVSSVDIPDAEILVINDGSTDPQTLLALEALGSDSRVTVVHRTNGGLGAARMTALGLATADFVLPLDADDRLVPGALSRALTTLRASSAADFVWGDYRLFGAAQGYYRSPSRWLPWTLTYMNPYPVSSLFRRSVLEGVGGWRGWAYEDWDLWLRLVAAGRSGVYLPGPLYERRIHEDPRLLSRARRQHRGLYAGIRTQNEGLFSTRKVLRDTERPSLWQRILYPLAFGSRWLLPSAAEGLLRGWVMQRGKGIPGAGRIAD